MNKKKGMSQVLSIIVAASVLMMAGMTLIFLVTGSIGDFGKNILGGTCTNTIKTQCSSQGGTGTVTVPNQCYSDDDTFTEAFNSLDNSGTATSPGEDEYNCEDLN